MASEHSKLLRNFALTGRLTEDKRLRYRSVQIDATQTSFIREPLSAIGFGAPKTLTMNGGRYKLW